MILECIETGQTFFSIGYIILSAYQIQICQFFMEGHYYH